MGTFNQTWNATTEVIAFQTIVTNSTTSTGYVTAEVDLSTKNGAMLTLYAGKRASATLTSGVDILVYPKILDGSVYNPGRPVLETNVLSSSTTQGGTSLPGATAGLYVIAVASGTNFSNGEWICISDYTAGTLNECEFHRISKVVTNNIYLETPLLYAHEDVTNDDLVGEAERPISVYLQGGLKYQVMFDARCSTVDSTVAVGAYLTVYDHDTSA